jgi:uncharacterized DUF497 family protein
VIENPQGTAGGMAALLRPAWTALLADAKHSDRELRFHALGNTDEGRLLHVAFTLREAGAKIRVISARNMHRKERAIYEQTT